MNNRVSHAAGPQRSRSLLTAGSAAANNIKIASAESGFASQ
jgi:hypothetical protein